jgi:glutamate--cysteine ligase
MGVAAPGDLVVGRSRPHPPAARPWLDYVLAADVMLIRSPHGAVAVPPGLAFGRWMTDGHPVGWPTPEDLRHHLTTLFPPVRPRGWLEMRMLDLLPPGVRDVATVIALAALTTDAARELEVRLPATDGLWCTAARYGLACPELAAAARILFDAVVPAVDAVTADPQRREAIRAFAERGTSPSQHVRDADLHTPFTPTLLSRVGRAVRAVRGSAAACAAAGAGGPAPAR